MEADLTENKVEVHREARLQALALATMANVLPLHKMEFEVACSTLYLKVAGSVNVAYSIENAKYNITLRLGYVPDQEVGFFALHDAVTFINTYLQHAGDAQEYSCLLPYPAAVRRRAGAASFFDSLARIAEECDYEGQVVALAKSLMQKQP